MKWRLDNFRLLKESMEERRQIEIFASIQSEVLLCGVLVCWCCGAFFNQSTKSACLNKQESIL